MSDEVRRAVAAACRTLAADGLVLGTAGNVSARVGDALAITATGARFESMTDAQVTIVGLDGEVLDGEFEPTSELGLHLGIYLNFGAGAVVHTHATTCVAVSCVVDELPCVHYQMLTLGGSVRVAPYATFGSAELAASVVEALRGKSAALLANHGAVTFGADLVAAVESTKLLEWAATIYWRARSMGEVRALDQDAQMAVVQAAVEKKYGTKQPLSDIETAGA